MTVSNIGASPAGRVRSDLRTVVSRDLGTAKIRLSIARQRIRDNARLAVLPGLSEAVETAYAAMLDASLDQGQSVPRMKAQAAIALAIVEEEIERMRPATVVVGGQVYTRKGS